MTKKNVWQRGVTMIELVVVLVIIGILVIIWAQWINPKVQLDKAKQAKEEEQVVEILKATMRYYYNHGSWPGIPNPVPESYNGRAVFSADLDNDLVEVLVEDGELKASAETDDNELIDGSGSQELAIIIMPETCSCRPLETDYCNGLEGPWFCVVPSDASDRNTLEHESNPVFVELNHDSPGIGAACRIFDPNQTEEIPQACLVNPDHDWSLDYDQQPCWKCFKP